MEYFSNTTLTSSPIERGTKFRWGDVAFLLYQKVEQLQSTNTFDAEDRIRHITYIGLMEEYGIKLVDVCKGI